MIALRAQLPQTRDAVFPLALSNTRILATTDTVPGTRSLCHRDGDLLQAHKSTRARATHSPLKLEPNALRVMRGSKPGIKIMKANLISFVSLSPRQDASELQHRTNVLRTQKNLRNSDQQKSPERQMKGQQCQRSRMAQSTFPILVQRVAHLPKDVIRIGGKTKQGKTRL